MSNRTTSLQGQQFASGGTTVIPPTPTAGVTYRNTATLTNGAIPTGLPFSTICDSAFLNEFLNVLSGDAVEAESWGIMRYCSLVDYGVGAWVVGSDTTAYRCIQANGPDLGGTQDPVSAPAYWETMANYIGAIPTPTTSIVGIKGAASNLKILVNTAATATVTADELCLEDGSGNYRIFHNVSKGINTGTTGAGGLDTGSVGANTFYYFYLIYNPTTSDLSAMLSLNKPTPASLPSGYTFYARVGTLKTGISGLLITEQTGKTVKYIVDGTVLTGYPLLASATSVGNINAPATAISITGVVPPSASMIGLVATAFDGDVVVAPNNHFGSTTSTNQAPLHVGTTDYSATPATFMLESTNIYWASYNVTGHNNNVYCTGWEESL